MLHKALHLVTQSGLETSPCSVYIRHIFVSHPRRCLAKLTCDSHRCDGRVWRGLCLPTYCMPLPDCFPSRNQKSELGNTSYSRNPVDTFHLERVITYCLQSFFLADKSKSQNGVFQYLSWSSLAEAHTPASPASPPAEFHLPCFKILTKTISTYHQRHKTH